MAWLNPSTNAPNVDSGQVVPADTNKHNVPSVTQSNTVWLLGIWAKNNSGALQSLKIFDSSGTTEYANVPIPDGWDDLLREAPFRPLGPGMQYQASSASIQFHIWGYQG